LTFVAAKGCPQLRSSIPIKIQAPSAAASSALAGNMPLLTEFEIPPGRVATKIPRLPALAITLE
jgi:hypothetical protein